MTDSQISDRFQHHPSKNDFDYNISVFFFGLNCWISAVGKNQLWILGANMIGVDLISEFGAQKAEILSHEDSFFVAWSQVVNI